MIDKHDSLLSTITTLVVMPIKIMLMCEGAYKDLVDTQTVKKRKDVAFLINFVRNGFPAVGQDALVYQ